MKNKRSQKAQKAASIGIADLSPTSFFLTNSLIPIKMDKKKKMRKSACNNSLNHSNNLDIFDLSVHVLCSNSGSFATFAAFRCASLSLAAWRQIAGRAPLRNRNSRAFASCCPSRRRLRCLDNIDHISNDENRCDYDNDLPLRRIMAKSTIMLMSVQASGIFSVGHRATPEVIVDPT